MSCLLFVGGNLSMAAFAHGSKVKTFPRRCSLVTVAWWRSRWPLVDVSAGFGLGRGFFTWIITTTSGSLPKNGCFFWGNIGSSPVSRHLRTYFQVLAVGFVEECKWWIFACHKGVSPPWKTGYPMYYPLLQTNISPEKVDGWKRTIPFKLVPFQGDISILGIILYVKEWADLICILISFYKLNLHEKSCLNEFWRGKIRWVTFIKKVVLFFFAIMC